MRKFYRHWNGPQFFFLFFFFVILIAYFVWSPGWGFMDDFQCGETARAFWRGDLSPASMIKGDIHGYGRFRPVYYLWVIGAYWLQYPLALYLLILAAGFAVLLVWGRIINRLFHHEFSSLFNQFIYPLAFFLFLPFWNIFMYISVQEKFVFMFGSLSFYFLVRSYQQGLWRDFVLALGLAVLAMLGKETGVAFLAAYGAFAFLDVCLFKKDTKRSLALLGICLAAGIGYVLFIKSVLGGYTAGYKTNLEAQALLSGLQGSPSTIKAVLAMAVGAIFLMVIDFTRKRMDFHPLFLVCPFWVIFYVALLLPWGFPHYLLAPLAPFVMMCGYYFLYKLFLRRQSSLRWIQAGVIICVLAVLFSEILPRISKMADKRKIIEALAALNTQAPGKFFYPPVYEETAMALERFSSVKIIYTGSITAEDIASRSKNYLVINDEASAVSLQGVTLTDEVYRSGTWLIRVIEKKPNADEKFRLVLPKNMIQQLKGFITSH